MHHGFFADLRVFDFIHHVFFMSDDYFLATLRLTFNFTHHGFLTTFRLAVNLLNHRLPFYLAHNWLTQSSIAFHRGISVELFLLLHHTWICLDKFPICLTR